jgi:hypothetical protein
MPRRLAALSAPHTVTDERVPRSGSVRSFLPALAAVVAVAVALRGWEAWESSLWLDELHTLAHASQPDVGAVIDHVRRERVHQPLFFLAIHALGGWEHGAALRWVPVLSSLLVLGPMLAFARAAGMGKRATLLAAWLFACVPYLVHYSTELRPYAWLMALSAGAACAAFAESGSRAARLALFAACVLLGMWTHRFMAVAVVAIGGARLLVRSRAMVPLVGLVAAGAVAVAPTVPWMLEFAKRATTDRFEYQAAHGGYRLRPQLAKEVLALPLRVFVPYLGALGGVWANLARAGAAAFFAVAVLAAGAAWMRKLRGSVEALPPQLKALFWYAAFDFVLVTGAAVYTWDRVPLQYYAAIVWVLPLALAAMVERLPCAARTPAAIVLAASALVLGVAQAGGLCTEDMRRGVATAREAGAKLREPIYTALLSQPTMFEHTLPYHAYARDLHAVEPAEVPPLGAPGSERPVVALLRGVDRTEDEAWKGLLAGRNVAFEAVVDEYLRVVVLEPLARDGD